MTDRAIQAVFMRGGTSKALMFHARDLPADRAEWTPILTAAMGSPDPYGRQLNGMGGGVSSVSKVCVLGPPTRADADIDYTFVQVLVREARLDLGSNCGNMSSAVGPFAVDEGLVAAEGDSATVRIHNTNTSKIIHATFPLAHGRARSDGDLAIPGVAGTGAPVRLDFLDPGGASTGHLLPSGQLVDTLEIAGLGPLTASLIDAGNATVFVRAADLGLSGLELPERIEGDAALMARLAEIRLQGSIRMGIAADRAAARASATVPFLCLVSPPVDATTLSGETLRAADIDLHARALATGQPHRALPITVSLCTAVAARMPGTVVADTVPAARAAAPLRIGMPSGVLTVDADVRHEDGLWVARSGAFYRTCRRLFDGRVWLAGA